MRYAVEGARDDQQKPGGPQVHRRLRTSSEWFPRGGRQTASHEHPEEKRRPSCRGGAGPWAQPGPDHDRYGRPGQHGDGRGHRSGPARLAQRDVLVAELYLVGIVGFRGLIGYPELRLHRLRLVRVHLRLVQFEFLKLGPQQRVVRAVVEFGYRPFDVRRLLIRRADPRGAGP